MFNQAISGKPLPKHLSTDHDPLFRCHRWRANLRVLEIDEIKTVPFVPCSHPLVEGLIGTIRREYLDHLSFWSRLDLQRKLARFAVDTSRYIFCAGRPSKKSCGLLAGNSVASDYK